MSEETTWKEVVAAETGKVFIDKFEEGVRFIVLRGPAALCAYLGVPLDHPLAGFDYDSLPVECHGGLTFGSGKNDILPEGFIGMGGITRIVTTARLTATT